MCRLDSDYGCGMPTICGEILFTIVIGGSKTELNRIKFSKLVVKFVILIPGVRVCFSESE